MGNWLENRVAAKFRSAMIVLNYSAQSKRFGPLMLLVFPFEGTEPSEINKSLSWSSLAAPAIGKEQVESKSVYSANHDL